MFKIGIFDEDDRFIKNLMDIISGALLQYCEWETQVFKSSNGIIQQINTGAFKCNLLFMDVIYKDSSGIDIAKMMCEKQVDADIIFITSSDKYVFECYKYHAFAYLLKPIDKDELKEELHRYMSEVRTSSRCLNISTRGKIIQIPIEKIIYIESSYRTVKVHTKNDEYEYYEKLNNLEMMLKDDGFIRCHQSYLVSERNITSFESAKVELGDVFVPVSRKYAQNLKEYLNKTDDNMKDSNCYITSSLAMNQERTGALVCVKGAYIGAIIRIKPEQEIIIGRDGDTVDMVVNLPQVSRIHCSIIYHEQSDCYELVDMSSNGTFINDKKRLVQNESYMIKAGSSIGFGSMETVYKLG